MSREIKFRAWNGSEMTFIEDLYWFEENMIHNVHDIPEHGAIMQYTGIKDDNGVEIYEGDSLYASGNFEDEGDLQFVGHVEWDENDARFEVVSFHGRLEYIPRGCVVRGNIYEHPNLLSGSDAEEETSV